MVCELLFGCLCLAAVAFDARCVWLVGGLGVDRIVDARVYSLLTPRVCYRFVVCALGGCCCLCRPY